jgi:cytochrome b6-f complex iron-sulfur subunit
MGDDAGQASERRGGESRRSFLDAAIKGGLAVCAGGMAVPAGLYLLPVGSGGPHAALVSAGPAEPFEKSSARLVQGEGKPVLVLSLGDGRYKAFSAICTHLGCIVKWDPETRKILCPCHAGVFGADGKVVGGPPSRPLPEYEVLKQGNELKVRL